MRTYSIRELRVEEGGTAVVIDFVLHLEPGFTGPASAWASQTSVGDELLIIGPRRGRPNGGGIEYAPGEAREILLAGDETAAPAIARILEDIDRDAAGLAVIEVPHAEDALAIDALGRAGGRGERVAAHPNRARSPGRDGDGDGDG